MTFAKKHNKGTGSVFTFRQEEGVSYYKLKEMFEKGFTDEKNAFQIVGFFVNRGGRYGDSCSAICKGFNVNLPSHMLHTVEDIMRDQEDIDAVNAGSVWAYVYEYTNSRGGKSYALNFVDRPVKEELPF